jgi:hypothetical protein
MFYFRFRRPTKKQKSFAKLSASAKMAKMAKTSLSENRINTNTSDGTWLLQQLDFNTPNRPPHEHNAPFISNIHGMVG